MTSLYKRSIYFWFVLLPFLFSSFFGILHFSILLSYTLVTANKYVNLVRKYVSMLYNILKIISSDIAFASN